jgi:phosphatidylglycerol:prolipoprotein diacylglycerol transferase
VKKISAPLLADVMIPSLLLGVGFGRVGCFLNGCCYGDRCDLGWCFAFPAGSVPDVALVSQGVQAADDVLRRISLHPAQLYSAFDGVVLAFLTASYFRRRPYDGAVVTLGWLCYPITRFLIEYVRDDEAHVVVPLRTFLFFGDEVGGWQSPFTISQWVSFGLFAAGLVFLWWIRRRHAQSLASKGPVAGV